MKREKKIVSTKREHEHEPQAILWLNKGGTHMMADKRIIKPMQKFRAFENQIPKAFRDVIVPVDAKLLQQQALKAAKPEYKVKASDRFEGMFDVIDGRGKLINDDPLDEDRAQQIVKRLME